MWLFLTCGSSVIFTVLFSMILFGSEFLRLSIYCGPSGVTSGLTFPLI